MNLNQLAETTRIALGAMWVYPGRTILIASLFVVASLAEGLGVASILPLLSLIGDGTTDQTTVSRAVESAIGFIGLEPKLTILLMLIAMGIALKAGLTFLAMGQLGFATAGIAADLRSSMLAALLEARWSYFINEPIGVLANTFGIEANNAAGMVGYIARMFALLVQIIMYLTIAVLVSWQVTVAAITAGVILFISLDWLVGMAREAGAVSLTSMRALLAHLADSLQGIKPLKAMALEDRVEPLLAREIEKLNKASQRLVLAKEAMSNIQEPVLVTLLCVGFYVTLTFTAISFDIVMVMGFVFYRTAGRFTELQTSYQAISVSREYYVGLKQKTQEAEAEHENHIGKTAPSLSDAIRLENVDFSYGENMVLDNVSMEIAAHSITTIFGPSGTGKTTATDLILAFISPDRGRLSIDGTDLADIDIQAWRKEIGYVPQELFLFHDSILQNVTLGSQSFTEADALRALAQAGADFVTTMPDGIRSSVGERGNRLSGGQRQRVAIARALIRKPKLLILDEPTTALDPKTEREICQTLVGLKDAITILAISHQSAVAEIADIVYELSGGTVAGDEKDKSPPPLFAEKFKSTDQR